MTADPEPASDLSPRDFSTAFRRFLEHTVAQAEVPEPPLRARLRAHFDRDPASLAVASEQFEGYDHPNLQQAVDELVAAPGTAAELVGIAGQSYGWRGVSLTDLALPTAPQSTLSGGPPPVEGPVERVSVSLGEDEGPVACVHQGLYLLRVDDQPSALLLRGPSEHGFSHRITVEVMAPSDTDAQVILARIRANIRERNVYRGRVLSLEVKPPMAVVDVHVHRLPRIEREAIVLADGVLERVERHVITAANHSERLRRAGRHLKRGLLLHGPPGAGKTLTAMYLASRMPERTVLLVTGQGIGLVERCAALARMLQPAMVVLEDVDLVGEERTRQGTGANSVLFELLNQMDGLADDADVVFLLTTNRPELLEPALASRPGRVDLAVQVPLPDARCRARLIELYGQGLTLDLEDAEGLVERTEGVSPAFIKELLRKAAVLAAEEDASDPITVRDRHLNEVLHELVVEGGELTQALLGVERSARRSC